MFCSNNLIPQRQSTLWIFFQNWRTLKIISVVYIPSVSSIIVAFVAFSNRLSRVTVFSQSPRSRPIASASRLESWWSERGLGRVGREEGGRKGEREGGGREGGREGGPG